MNLNRRGRAKTAATATTLKGPRWDKEQRALNLFTSTSSPQEREWFSATLPVPKSSQSAKRFVAKPAPSLINLSANLPSSSGQLLRDVKLLRTSTSKLKGMTRVGLVHGFLPPPFSILSPSSPSAHLVLPRTFPKKRNLCTKKCIPTNPNNITSYESNTKMSERKCEKFEEIDGSRSPSQEGHITNVSLERRKKRWKKQGSREKTEEEIRPIVGRATVSDLSINKLGKEMGERMQVSRSEEEKRKNPESIRMDKLGLKMFPIIGPGEGNLKLISLQHNLISRVDGLPQAFNHLLVLDLYDNKMERMSGLGTLSSLRVLLLGKNRIRRIEGLDGLKRLEVLDLHGNQLRYVDNLGSLSALRVLNLAGNLLRNIRNLGPYGLASLNELNLKRNRIRNLDGLQKAPHLKKLLLANNEISSFSALNGLKKLFQLQELLLEQNPLCGSMDYQSQVLTVLPLLETLDRCPINDQMRLDAKIWARRRVSEEEEKRKERARLRTAPTFLGSREEIIYEARRRWESVKNFVKNTSSKPHPTGREEEEKDVEGVEIFPPSNSPTLSHREEECEGGILSDPPTHVFHMIDDLSPQPRVNSNKTNFPSLSPPAVGGGNKKQTSVDQHDQTPEKSSKNNNIDSPLPQLLPSGTRKEIESEAEISLNECQNAGALNEPQTNDLIEPEVNQTIEGEIEVNNKIEGEIPHRAITTITPGEIIKNEEGKIEKMSEDHYGSFISKDVSFIPSDVSRPMTKIAIVRPVVRAPCERISSAVSSALGRGLRDIQIKEQDEKGSCECIEKVGQIAQSFLTQFGRETGEETVFEVEEETIEEDCYEVQLGVKIPPPQLTAMGSEEQFREKTQEEPQPNIQKLNIEKLNIEQKIEQFKIEQNMEKIEQLNTEKMKPENANSEHEKGISLGRISQGRIEKYSEKSSEKCSEKEKNEGSKKERKASLGRSSTRRLSAVGRSASTSLPPTHPETGNWSEFDNGGFPISPIPNLSQRESEGGNNESCFNSKRRNKLSCLRNLKSASLDVPFTSSASDSSEEETDQSHRTTKKQTLPALKGRTKRGGERSSARNISNNTTAVTPRRPQTTRGFERGRLLKRSDSLAQLETTPALPIKKQGADYLVEIDGKTLNVYGQGALKHTLTGFSCGTTGNVSSVKFHYISYDSIIPFFGKLRQIYPSLEHFQFRANNLSKLSQLNSLADLQGLSSLQIAKEGNPIVLKDLWVSYAAYRLSHWGLQTINGKEISSEYRGGTLSPEVKVFESLGYLALSCLPQSALTPLAKRIHMLHCFCCCSPSSSSDDSGRRKNGVSESPRSICNSWDDDPVLLDVIGKEALIYTPAEDQAILNSKKEVPEKIIESGCKILKKLDLLEKTWPVIMQEVIQNILMDYLFMDNYTKKELKKLKNIALITKKT